MTQYPDSPEGAQRVLEDQRTWADGENASQARYTPDPEINGCWLATFPSGRRMIVYTDGHPFYPPTFEEETD